MKFKKDGSLKNVAITESELHELFRSTKPAVPTDKSISSGECEAYLCASKESGKLKVYVAFWEISSKTSRVYVPEQQPLGTTDYQKCIDNALEFVKELGFTMEGVNLSYGTAMRQVIWGTVKVFKPPKPVGKASAPEKGKKIADKDASETTPPKEKPASPDKPEKPVEEKKKTEEREKPADRADDIESKEEMELKIKVKELSAINDELVARSSEMENEIKDLKNQLKETRSALEKEQHANKDLRNSHEEESQMIAKGIVLLQERISELESSEETNQETYETSLQQLEEQVAAEQKMRQDAEEASRLALKEKAEADKTASAALESARKERDELIQKLEAMDEKQKRVMSDLETKFNFAKSDQETARAETEKYRKELLVSKEMYDIELTSLRTQLRQLLENKSPEPHELPITEKKELPEATITIDQPLPLPASECAQKIDDVPPRSTLTINLGTVSGETVSNSVQSPDEYGDDPDAPFLPDRSLTSIPGATTDSIVAVFESANKIQTVPSGYKIQKSGGYICAVKRNGVPEIFLVWQMLESKQSLIYKPKKQPEDDESYNTILQEALFYFESVGFMMSEVDLNSAQEKSGVLKKILMAA